jgi:type III secretory pathway component EscT
MTQIKNIQKIIPLFFIVFILVTPLIVNAQIIPCGGHILDPNTGAILKEQPACDFNFLLQMVNNIIKWMVMISAPVAAGIFAWAGFLYMTTGISDQKNKAKSMIVKVFIGFVVILAAWLIVSTVIDALLKPSFRNVIDISMISSINLYI